MFFKVPLCENRTTVYKSLMIEQIDLLRDNAFIEQGITHIGDHHNIEDEIEAIGDNTEQLYNLFFEIMSELSGLTDNEIKQDYPPLEA
jgi:hypothetical protein